MNLTKYEKFFLSWKEFLTETTQSIIDVAHHQINLAVQKTKVYPSPDKVYRAFEECPEDNVRVVIVGMDPYHDGSGVGLCFANKIVENKEWKKYSPSLKNIVSELFNDLRSTPNSSGIPTDVMLGHLPSQGVLLLNTALTVEEKKPESHLKIWEPFLLIAIIPIGFPFFV